MSRRPRRNHTPGFKAKVAFAAIKGDRTLAQLAAVESIVEADPLANCVRTIMHERSSWTGSASDLLRLCAEGAREDTLVASPPWAKNPRALAGRLRRAQTFLRMLGIEMTFGREGRSGARIIRLSALGQSRSSAVGMDRNDGQNERYRVNGEGWLPSQSSTPDGVDSAPSASSVPSG